MKISTDKKKIQEILERGVESIVVFDSLKKKLESGKQLRVKFGIDPTGTDLHLGHTVPLRKLQQFQELGHKVILLIGDYTAMVGDPSGRDTTRPMLTEQDVQENMKSYLDQAGMVLDLDSVEVRYNSEWFKEKGWGFAMELTGMVTVARILERDDFQKRLQSGSDIQMQEILYPLMQGYDSVALKADVEIGGSDQTFNLLMGRKLQKKYNQPEQDIITLPLLEGTDGIKKMSKSYGNYIALNDSPEDMFGKTMSIPDELIEKYYSLATRHPFQVIKNEIESIKKGKNPRDVKMALAYSITKQYHGEDGAEKGQEYFEHVIQGSERPSKIPELKPSDYNILTVLVKAGFCSSKSEARRTIDGGGVQLNDQKVETYEVETKPGDVVQKGKRFFVKVL